MDDTTKLANQKLERLIINKLHRFPEKANY